MKPFTGIAIVFLALIATLQLLRSIMGWEVSVNGMSVPTWASVMAFIITGGLALMLWKESRA